MQYGLPAVITLPFAAIFTAIYNSGKVVEDVVINPIKQGTDESCTVPVPPKTRLNVISSGKDIARRLTELNVHEEDQLKVIKVLNNLEWVKVENVRKDNLYNRAMVLLEKFFSDFQADKAKYIYLVAVNLLSCFACHMILKHSIVGILLKILMDRVKSFILYPFQFFRRASSSTQTSNGGRDRNSEEQDGQEEIVECSFSPSATITPMIDPEEILAGKDRLEEKHGESNENIDKGYESFVHHVQSEQEDTFSVPPSPTRKYYNTRNTHRSEDIEHVLDPNEGYIGGGEDESGDEW